MNNEPVAWMQIHHKDGKPTKFSKVQTWEDDIPLYTHPADTTDKEILTAIKCIADDVSPHKEYENTYSDGWLDACNTVYDEVFAILRKAQSSCNGFCGKYECKENQGNCKRKAQEK